MPRYIDKDKIANKLKEDYATLVKERWFDDYVQGYGSAIDDIIAEPTADVQEVKHGKMNMYKPRSMNRNATYKCSVCGKLCSSYYNDVGEWKFCPYCGATMLEN